MLFHLFLAETSDIALSLKPRIPLRLSENFLLSLEIFFIFRLYVSFLRDQTHMIWPDHFLFLIFIN